MRNVPFLVAAAVLAMGCHKSSSEESSPEGQMRVEGGQYTLTNGSSTVGLGDKVPDDFPKAVPIYPGAKVNLSTRNGGKKPAWSLTLVTGDDPAHVMTFYRSNLAGFTASSDREMGDTYMSIWQSPQYDLTLLVAQAPAQDTSISMTVTGK